MFSPSSPTFSLAMRMRMYLGKCTASLSHVSNSVENDFWTAPLGSFNMYRGTCTVLSRKITVQLGMCTVYQTGALYSQVGVFSIVHSGMFIVYSGMCIVCKSRWQVGMLCFQVGLLFTQVGVLCTQVGVLFTQVGVLCSQVGELQKHRQLYCILRQVYFVLLCELCTLLSLFDEKYDLFRQYWMPDDITMYCKLSI